MSHDPESTLPENEKFTDVLDRASDFEMRATGFAIHEARKLAVPQQSPNPDGTFGVTECQDCGEDIGEARLRVAIKNKICITCANLRERRR